MFQLLELIENEEDREFCRKLSEQFDSAMYHVAYGILKNSACLLYTSDAADD